ncbi:MAG: glycosyltransferase [bacterium]|nr:glycosyltransferase [bacterium]
MISIIIPTLNEEKEIGNTLKNLEISIKKEEIEIIITDGKSKDKTAEIAHAHKAKVLVYEGEKRQTISAGKNDGAKEAVGEYLLFQDADVFIPDPSDFFRKMVAEFERDKKLMGATVFLKVRPKDATIGDKIVFGAVNYLFIIMNNFLGIGGATGEFQFVRADAFRKINGFNEKLVVAEDQDLFQRLTKIGRTKIISSLTVYHSGRRAHAIGWPRLLWKWWTNYFTLVVLKRSSSKEWEPLR